MKNKNKIITAVVLIVLLVGAFLAWTVLRPSGTDEVKSVTVTVIHADASENVFEVSTGLENLGDLLTKTGIASGTEGEYGLYITTVDGETADESQQQWWCITKAGEEVATGADGVILADGDKYELTLKTGW